MKRPRGLDLSRVAAGVEFGRSDLRITRKLTFDEWDDLGLLVREVEGAVQWWLGDWLNYGQRTYGETYKKARTLTGYDVQTLKNYAWVAKRFTPSLRKDDLPFTHYLYTAGLEDGQASTILDRAAGESWPVERTLTVVRQTRQAERLRSYQQQPLPKSQYQVIVADPPWEHERPISAQRSVDNHYPTMSVDEICALPVRQMAADDAVLFLWAFNPMLPEALQVIEAWGFWYRTNMVWVKDRVGTGKYVRGKHELLLIARRGDFPVPCDSARPESVILAGRREHSRKPDEAYKRIEKMYPDCRYLELFAREKRRGWEGWGFEYPSTADK